MAADRGFFLPTGFQWPAVGRKLEALVRTRTAESISADRYDDTGNQVACTLNVKRVKGLPRRSELVNE
jgi:hypothetical protein